MLKLGGLAIACSMFVQGISFASTLPDEKDVRDFLRDQLKMNDPSTILHTSVSGECQHGASKLPFAMDCQYYDITRLEEMDKPKKVDQTLYELLMPSSVGDDAGNFTPVYFTHSYVYYIKDRNMLVSLVTYTTDQGVGQRYATYKKMRYKEF